MSTTDTRAAFEAWAAKEFNATNFERGNSGGYINSKMHIRWESWQAATEAAKAEQSQDKPVMYCVPDKNGKPLFGKGWMFSPIPQLAATMPLYTRPDAKATGTAGELPGMWEPADLVGGETDMPLAARQPAPVVAVSVDPDVPQALQLLSDVFDAWENGVDCYEEPDECAGFLGKAFRLDDDIFNRCVELLNRRNPPRNAASTALQAPVAISTWLERIEGKPNLGFERYETIEERAMQEEIADLRAALDATNRSQP